MTHLKKTNSQSHIIKSLSVQISLIGHSFLVKDVTLGTVLFSHNITFPSVTSPDEALIALQNTIEEHPVLQETFETVTVVHQNNLVTIVPKALFDENEAVNYLKFNTKILPTDFIACDEINNQELVVVYVPYVNINNYFFENYGAFQYYHHSTIALKEAVSTSSFKEATTIHIDVAEDTFYCSVMAKGKLLLHNVYSYKTNEDFIYYVLFCFEQLQLDPNETPVLLSGKISKEKELYKLMYTYIRNLDMVDASALKTENANSQSLYLLSKAAL